MGSSARVLKLMSSDHQLLEVGENVITRSKTIKSMVEDGFAADVIPVPMVDAKTLVLVIKWCEKHVDVEEDDKVKAGSELYEWETEFLALDDDTDKLYALMMAANYLNIKDLLDKILQKVADMIKGKTPGEIRKTFKIVNDFAPEEEAAIRRENPFA